MISFSELKFLTDENISPKVVSFLREHGFDVLDVKESALCGSTDNALMELALKEQRYVATHDADFGTLAINRMLPCYGVLYLRLKAPSAPNVIIALKKLISMNPQLEKGSLIVIDETRMRVRTL